MASCAVVGVGASAGGLDALRRLCSALPADAPFALVVLQHLDPSTPSRLAEILGKVSAMKVVRARSGQGLSPGTIYVVPEGREGHVDAGKLRLRQLSRECREPIDALFTSIANNHQHAGCAILLSGSGSDGVLGLRQVRGAGGLALVQDPSDAEFPSMPSAAIDAGVSDLVGTAEQIAADLLAHLKHPIFGAAAEVVPTKAKTKRDSDALAKLLSLVRMESGMDFSGYKKSTVLRRIGRRVMLHDMRGIAEYLKAFGSDPKELSALVDDLLINVTQFFRDPEVFDALRTRVFPEIIKSKDPDEDLRIWVVGCSTGEEVYSILITAIEAFEEAKQTPRVTVFGTDASEDAIGRARAGIYPQSTCASMSPERLAKFFIRTEKGFEIGRALREMCVFARQDVTRDTPFSRLDLVSIRNVLIYMDPPLQQHVLAIAHFALRPGGFLLLGTSETPESERGLFRSFDQANHVFVRQDVASRLPLDVAASTRASIDALSLVSPMLDFDTGTADPHAAANELALLLYAPPRVIIDANGHILHFFGDTTPYLEHAAGRATLELVEMAHPGIALELKDALDGARASGAAVVREASFVAGAQKRHVSIEITPLPGPPGEANLLVAFKENAAELERESVTTAADDLARLYESREQRVRRELGALRGRVRSIAEEKEQVNQSLRSANEEIRSSNEELQSINEELETAKEELQSANEELITVNDELRQTNRDLVAANDDLTNFATSIDVPVLMLDRSLRVRRFTPQAERIVHIEDSDVGRLLGHLRLRVDVAELPRVATEVIDSDHPRQLEVRDEDGRWFTMRLQPYRLGDGTVDGLVISFLDVDQVKRDAEKIAARARLSEALTAIDADIASTLLFDDIMQRALDRGVEALGSDSGAIEVREGADWVVRFQNGFSPAEVGRRLSAAEAPNAAAVARMRKPFTIGEMSPGDNHYVGFVADHDIRSALAVPLFVREEVMGALLFYRRRPRDFTAEEIDFGQRLGSAVSLALANARLLDAEHDAAHRAEALNAINMIVQSAVTPDQLLSRLVREVSDIAGADRSLVIDVADGLYTIRHVRNVGEGLVGKPMPASFFPGFALAAERKKPVLIADNWSDPRTNKEFVIPFELHSFQLLPLVVDDRTRAVLALAYNEPREFDEADQAFSSRLATAMSVALEKALLYYAEVEARGEAKNQLSRTQLLLDVSSLLWQPTDLATRLQGLARLVSQGLVHSRVTLSVPDERSDSWTVIAVHGGPPPALETFTLDEMSEAAHEAIASRRTVIADYAGESDRVRELTSQAEYRLAAMVPAVYGDRVMGLVVADQPAEKFEFLDAEIRLLDAIAAHMAVAIENDRLLAAEAARAEEAAVLRETAAAAASATDRVELSGSVLNSCRDMLGARAGTIYLYDSGADQLAATGLFGFPASLTQSMHTMELDDARAAARSYTRNEIVMHDTVGLPSGITERAKAAHALEDRWVSLPIRAHGQPIGSLGLIFPQQRAFAPDEVALFQALADQLGVGLDRLASYEAQSAELARTQILQSVAEAASSGPDFTTVSENVIAALADVLGVSTSVMYAFDEPSQILQRLASVGIEESVLESIDRVPLDHPILMAAKAARERRTVTNSDAENPKELRRRLAAMGVAGNRGVQVPLLSRERLLGVLVMGFEGDRPFSADELGLYESIADILSQALENARLFDAVQVELSGTSALLEASRASATLDLQSLLHRLVDVIAERTGRSRVVIHLVENESAIRTVAAHGAQVLRINEIQLLDDYSPELRAATLATEPTLVDFTVDGLSELAVAERVRLRVEVVLYVPLVVRGRRVGVMTIDDIDAYRPFSERQIELATGLGSQAAVAIDNARLFEIERRAAELGEALNRVDAAVHSALEFDAIMQCALDEGVEALGVQAGAIELREPGGWRIRFERGFGPEDLGRLLADEQAPSATTAERLRGPYAIADARPDEAANVGFVKEHGLVSVLAVPMFVRDAIIGCLLFYTTCEPREFTGAEMDFSRKLSSSVAVAIENARSFADSRRRATREHALRTVAESAASSLALGEVAEQVVGSVVDLLGASQAQIRTLSADGKRLVNAASRGMSKALLRRLGEIPVDSDVQTAVSFREGETCFGEDVRSASLSQASRQNADEGGVRSFALVPLVAGGNRIGILYLAWPEPRQFDDEEVSFIEAIGAEFSVGLQNAILFESEQESSAQLRTLHEMADLAASSLDISDVANKALSYLHENIGVGSMTLWLLRADGRLWPFSGIGFPKEFYDRFPEGIGLAENYDVATAVREGRTVVRSTSQLATTPAPVLSAYRRFKIPLKALVVVPVRSSESTVGALTMAWPEPREFDEADVRFYESIANELGVALENARLFEQAQAELERTKLLQSVTASVSTRLTLDEVGSAAVEAFSTIKDAAAAAVWWLDAARDCLVNFGAFGYPPELDEWVHEVPVDGTSAAGWLLTHDLDSLTQSDMPTPPHMLERFKQMGIGEARWVVLPLLVSGQLAGVMALIFHGERPFTEHELSLYRTMAAALSAAVANARLHEDLLDSERRVTDILASISDGFSAIDHALRFTYVNDEAARIIGGLPNAEELVGKTLGEAKGDPELDAIQRRWLDDALNHGKVIESETYYPQNDIWADIRVFPSRDGVSIYARDVTASKVAEEALRSERARADRLGKLLDEAALPFAAGTPDGRFLLANRAFETLTGFSASELHAISWVDELTPPEYRASEADHLAAIARTGAPVTYEKEYVRKDGTRVPVELLVNAAFAEDGEVDYYYAFVTDLTDRKQRERLDEAVNRIGALMSATLDRDEILKRLFQGICETMAADACAVLMLEGSSWRLRDVQGMRKRQLAQLLEHTNRIAIYERDDQARFTPLYVDDVAHDPRVSALAELGAKRLLAVPLLARGSVVGVLALAQTRSTEAFSAALLNFAARLMPLATLALENADLYQRERLIADTLQDALITAPPPLPGMQTSFVYRAASEAANVGGDFFDVFELAGGRCCVVVGDVSGKGLEAARITSLMRDGVRAYALESSHPSEILTRLNRLVCRDTASEQFATVFLAVIDLAIGTMRYCTAGHPTPLLIDTDKVEYLVRTKSPILGAFEDAEFHTHDTVLLPGERLVVYTDGVIEARQGSTLLGEDGLREIAETMKRTPLKRVPQRILDRVVEYGGGDLRDDTIVLVVARTPESSDSE